MLTGCASGRGYASHSFSHGSGGGGAIGGICGCIEAIAQIGLLTADVASLAAPPPRGCVEASDCAPGQACATQPGDSGGVCVAAQ